MFRPVFSEHDSARSRRLLALIVALGLVFSSGSTIGRVPEPVSNAPSATELALPRADGDELLSLPPALTPVEQLSLRVSGPVKGRAYEQFMPLIVQRVTGRP